MSKLVVANANRGGTELVESDSEDDLLEGVAQPVGIPSTLQEALALQLRDFSQDRDGARPTPAACRAAIALIADNVANIQSYLERCERDYPAADARANDLEHQRDQAYATMLRVIPEFRNVADIQQRILAVDPAMLIVARGGVLSAQPEWRRYKVLEAQAREARGHATRLSVAPNQWRTTRGQQELRIHELEATLDWWELQARELGVSIPA